MELVIGIDENGLGPRLGPLVVTAVAMEVESYDPKKLARALRRHGYTDSKDVCASGSMADGEAKALATVACVTKTLPDDFDALLKAVSLEGPDWLRAPCPSVGHEPCWGAALPMPRWATSDQVAEQTHALGRILERHGVRLVSVRSSVLCASRLNAQIDKGTSKSRIDLHAFEDLAVALVREAGREARIICGRVGMLKFYEPAFGALSNYLCAPLEESDHRSAYRLPRLGEIEFTVDADRTQPPVALASLVGKLLREGFVERMNAFYDVRVDGLRRASGYHDPVTNEFVERISNARIAASVPDRCFERAR
jgi:hypothetical protein